MFKTKALYVIIIIGLTLFIVTHISSFVPQHFLSLISSVRSLGRQHVNIHQTEIENFVEKTFIDDNETNNNNNNNNNGGGSFRKHDYTNVIKHVHEDLNIVEKVPGKLSNTIVKSNLKTEQSSLRTLEENKKVLVANIKTLQPSTVKKETFSNDKVMTEVPLKGCPTKGSKLVGPLFIDQNLPKPMDQKALSIEFGGTVEKGGWWAPSTCTPRTKVALIIPYRKREQQLKIFLNHLHPFLQRQQLFYRIIVVEQLSDDPFNRAGLFNIGFVESLKISPFDCFIFSDVDLLPEDDRNYYGCPTSPRHMSVAVDKFNYKLPYSTIFGGVGAFSKDHFEKINGMSNLFWGWGGEDDDLYQRISNEGLSLTRPSIQLGRYTMIRIHHFQSSQADPNRMNLLRNSKERMVVDGLNTLKYHLKEVVEQPLVTFVKIEMRKRDYFQ